MTHATAPRSARTLAQARPTMSCIHLVGASLSEPHTDEFAVEFVYIIYYIFLVRRAVNHFGSYFACSCIIRFVNSKTIYQLLIEKTRTAVPP